MLFERIGALAVRWRYLIIAVWIALVVGITVFAPNLSDVTTSDQADLLPKEAEFNHAIDVHKAVFSDSSDDVRVVLVVEATTDEGILNQDAATFGEQIDTTAGNYIAELCAWLASDDAPERITGVTCPVTSAQVASMTIDTNNHVAMIPLNLAEGALEFDATVGDPIHAWINEHQPEGVETSITGSQAVISAFAAAIVSTFDRTLIVTVVLVILLLLLIYRSPVSPIVPLVAVTLSYLITRGVVAVLADSVMTVSSYANVLLVAVIYGAGTDYCLFLISRFREEMTAHPGVPQATTSTVKNVGETITSSAGTIFVGFTAMIFAKFGLFNTTGPALAIGIIVSLLSGLTFVPALLSILGDHAFWPDKAHHRETGEFYSKTSNLVSNRPFMVMVVVILTMLPLGIHGVRIALSYSPLEDLPGDAEAKEGFETLSDSLGPGNLSPLSVVVTERDPATMSAEMVQLESKLLALKGVADVRSLNNPMGQHGDMTQLLRADTQLTLIAQLLSEQAVSGQQPDMQTTTAMFTGMQIYLNSLAEQFPEIANDPNMITLQDLFSNMLVYVQRQGEAVPALRGLAARFATVENPYVDLSSLASPISASAANAQNALLSQLLAMYIAPDGTSYRMTVILAGEPNSEAALDTVLDIRALLEQYKISGEAVIDGQPAMVTDLRTTLDSDLILTIGVVSLGIFIVLLLMLRSLIAPLYLIATVGLSYTFTLGLTDLVFRTFWGAENGLSFLIPVFAFVFLVALGVDYSIFLIGRVKEEVSHRGIHDGVHEAVVATGPIITSAGIILAGTFAAMMLGDIRALAELGFAVAVGVLIDTFVVRTMLVPSLTILLGKWAWWPGGVPQAKDAQFISVPAASTGDG